MQKPINHASLLIPQPEALWWNLLHQMKENEEKWLLELYFFYFRRKKYINNYINKYCWDFRFNYSYFSAWKGKKQFFQAIANKAWPLERALVFHSQWTNCSACVMGHREKEQWKSKKERDGERFTQTDPQKITHSHMHTYKSPSMKADYYSFV